MFVKKLFCTFVILLAGFAVISGFACASTEEPPSGWKLYQNDVHGFQISYPQNWKLVFQLPSGYAVRFNSPDVDDVIESVDVMVESSGDMSLDELAAAIKDDILTSIPDAIISNKKKITLHGRTGYEWIARWEYKGRQLKHKQVLFVAHGKAYGLLCSAADSTYNDYAASFAKFIDSFVIE